MPKPTLDLEGKVCPNHPNTPAVARCFACFRPVCEECVVEADDENFCSEKCAEAHARTDKTFKDFSEAEKRQRRKRLIKRTIVLIILIALLWFAVSYWINHPETVNLWFEELVGALGGLKDGIAEIIQGLTG